MRSWWELLHLLNCRTDQQLDARPVPCPVGQPDSLLPPESLPVHLATLNLTCGEAPRGASFPSSPPPGGQHALGAEKQALLSRELALCTPRASGMGCAVCSQHLGEASWACEHHEGSAVCSQ